MTVDAPSMSVIIPVLNGGKTIGEQLVALAAQRDAPSFEVLVCDNGSTDDTREVAAKFADEQFVLRIVDASDRGGASHARNVGLARARGQIVAFCDADDVVAEDWLAVLHRTVAPGHVVAGWLDLARLNPAPESGRNDDGIERSLVPISGYLPGIGSGNVALHRADAIRLGGFDESFRYGVEDIDFGWRAQQAGLTLSREPATVYVRLRGDAGAAFAQHRRWGRGNIMLRVRHAADLGNTMSFRYSTRKVLADGARLVPVLLRPGAVERRQRIASFGTTVGEFEGHLLFRTPGGLPEPELLEDGVVRKGLGQGRIASAARYGKHRLWRAKVRLERTTVPPRDRMFRRLDARHPFEWDPALAVGSPQHGHVGHPAASDSDVPRRIFLLWTGENEMPATRSHCVDRMRAQQAAAEVVLITPANLGDWVLSDHPLHPAYEYLSLVHRSDYLRAYLMHHYGGGYSDIKRPRYDWGPAWAALEADTDALAIGYTETTSAGVGRPGDAMAPLLRRHFSRLLGMCAFIMRPQSSLTGAWLKQVEEVLDEKLEALTTNPGNVWGDNRGYPLKWTELLGDVLHPWMLVHSGWLLHAELLLPDVSMETYR